MSVYGSVRGLFGGSTKRDPGLSRRTDTDAKGIDLAESVYASAGREYNVFYAGLVVSARWWKRAFFTTNISWVVVNLALLAFTFAIYASGGNHVYAVTTNSKGVVVGPSVEVNTVLTPTDAEVQSRLVEFTRAAFMVTPDAIVTRNNLDFVTAFSAGEAGGFLTDYYGANGGALSPFTRGRSETVEVVVNKVGSISPQTWEVDWTEIERDFSGRELKRTDKSASFSVGVLAPATPASAIINPFGVRVTRMRFLNNLGPGK